MEKVLITGASGFVGTHLSSYLSRKGYEIIATYRPESDITNLKGISKKLGLLKMDLTDSSTVEDVINNSNADHIFHLASQTSASLSFKDPETTFKTNISGTINLLETLRKRKRETSYNPKIYVILSQEAFGIVYPEEIPVDESQPYRPNSPYGISKATMHLISTQYSKAYGLDIILLRPFTHAGPKQKIGFLFPDFASQIVEIEKGKKEPVISVGNLEAVRDYLHVNDVIHAYHLIMDKGRCGDVYNICSGIGTPVKNVLEEMISQSTSQEDISIKKDPKRMRPSDTPLFIGSYKLLNKLTGWKPKYNLKQIVKDVLDDWRSNI